ncbi:MAG: hypothetical protein EOO22_25035, partial [Comamonadaceae bacterium]
VTAFGLFLTPVFYVLMRRLAGNKALKLHGEAPHAIEAVATPTGGGGGLHAQPAAPHRSHE